MAVQVGSPAPPFDGKAYLAAKDAFTNLSLKDQREEWVCLCFFPGAFSPICPTELIALDESHDEFEQRVCQLIGCSTDSHYALRGWCRADEHLSALRFPLLADATKRIAMDYGVLLAARGLALRGTFIIDPQGVLRYSGVNEVNTGRGIDEILRTLDALQTGQPCACNWKKSEPTLEEGM